MRHLLRASTLLAVAVALCAPVAAQSVVTRAPVRGLIDSYVALDESDAFFDDEVNRQALENMLANGAMSSDAARIIVKGGAIIQVDIYGRGTLGDWIEVTVLN